MYRPVQHEFELSPFNRHHHHHHHHLTHSYCIPCRSPRGSTVPYSTRTYSCISLLKRGTISSNKQQTTNSQKRLYNHACIRVAPLQPNEWPLSRHLLQSNSAAALLCSLLCFLQTARTIRTPPRPGWAGFPPAQVSMVSYPRGHTCCCLVSLPDGR